MDVGPLPMHPGDVPHDPKPAFGPLGPPRFPRPGPASCDHGPECPVWSAQFLTPEDIAALGPGWVRPTEHVVPFTPPPPSRPRPRRWLTVWAVITLLYAGWTAIGYSLLDGLKAGALMLIPLGIYVWTLYARRSG